MAARTQNSARRVADVLSAQLPVLVEPAAQTSRRALGELIVLCTDLVEALDQPTRMTTSALAHFVAARDMSAPQHDALVRAVVGTEPLSTLRTQAEDAASHAVEVIAQTSPLPATVLTSAGAVHLPDFLKALTIEIGLLADHCSTQLDRQGFAQALRTCSAVLGERFPGKTIEVRVPPLTAVQLGTFGEGPVHHRGTPPNVVETDPQMFWSLCTGGISWAQAREQHLLRVSGVHAGQLERMLPLVHLR